MEIRDSSTIPQGWLSQVTAVLAVEDVRDHQAMMVVEVAVAVQAGAGAGTDVAGNAVMRMMNPDLILVAHPFLRFWK